MGDVRQRVLLDTAPSASRERSYDGDYMAAGRKAETIVLDWLRTRPEVIGVEDLTGLRQMREADVDCSVALMDGRVTLAEIKSDAHLGVSGNVLFEVLRINHTAPHDRAVTLGWSARSPAHWLLFYAPAVGKIYRWSMEDYRNGLQLYAGAERARARMSFVATDKIKSTVNILVPEEWMKPVTVYSLGGTWNPQTHE
jgi:hypothetical protein